jgi:hypothetical protein
MSRQFYHNNNMQDHFPLWFFYVLDLSVHVVGCGFAYWCWWKYVDPVAALGAWIYHRLWSLVHSRGETLYFTEVEVVYGFHYAMPAWAYVYLYLSETLVVGYCFWRAFYPGAAAALSVF